MAWERSWAYVICKGERDEEGKGEEGEGADDEKELQLGCSLGQVNISKQNAVVAY